MKKIILSAIMSIALVASVSLSAQETANSGDSKATKKECCAKTKTCDKSKKECCAKKKGCDKSGKACSDKPAASGKTCDKKSKTAKSSCCK